MDFRTFFKQWTLLKLYLLFVVVMIGLMAYANYTGWRLYTFSNQESWKASGPGGHK